MKSLQVKYIHEKWFIPDKFNIKADFVFVFGSRELLENTTHTQKIQNIFPHADILFCSSAGEIDNEQVYTNSIIATGISFEKTKIQHYIVNIENYQNSYDAGKNLAKSISIENLQYLLLISDGHIVNGSDLTKGINTIIPKHILLTGGLAGDNHKFSKTVVGINEYPKTGNIVAIGFYGNDLQIGYSVSEGWERFGPKKKITKSQDNILYELNGKNALNMYKQYLGVYSKELPQAALNFPLGVEFEDNGKLVVRSILKVDEEEQSMTFAGNVPMGKYASFMKANMDKLIDAASIAAQKSIQNHQTQPDLILVISCVGRKFILGPRTEEELEVINEVFDKKIPKIGFYSYGEIAPNIENTATTLHNETMTITTFKEL